MGIAKHYETGENLPEEVYRKLLAARTFRAGSQSLRQVCGDICIILLRLFLDFYGLHSHVQIPYH